MYISLATMLMYSWWHGGRSQAERQGEDLCGPHKTERECKKGATPTTSRWSDTCTASRSKCVHKTWCQLRILADPPGSIIGSTDHLYNTFWSILLPPNALWGFISPRAFSAMNVRNLEWPCRCCGYDGRHSHPWQDTRGARRKTGESAPMNARGWSDIELWKVSVCAEVSEVLGALHWWYWN